MLTILQGSDVHFGKPHDGEATRLFLSEVERLDPDLVVVAGDFTQRAKVGEFSEARRFLDALSGRRVVVTPGNHDVALFRVWERLGWPFKNYRRFVHPDLDFVVRLSTATVVSLNTAAPRRAIVNGRLDRDQIDFAARVFHQSPEDDFKCIVMHHPLVPPPDGGEDSPLPRSDKALARLHEMGVNLVLGGHFHRAFAVRSVAGGPVVCHSGTATSTRGRRGEASKNSFNVIHVEAKSFVVTRFLREESGPFHETWSETFDRGGVAVPTESVRDGGGGG